MFRRIILSLFLFSCTFDNRFNIDDYNIQNYNYFHYDTFPTKSLQEIEKDWQKEIQRLEKDINSLNGTEHSPVKLEAISETCKFGEKSCKFIARAFPDGKIEIFSGILNEIDLLLLQSKSYPNNKNHLRYRYLAGIVSHEYCHLLNQDFSRRKNIYSSKSEKEIFIQSIRNLETEADSCSIHILKTLNIDPEYVALNLNLLKDLYRKRNEITENRIDFFDYTYLHPSPNKRLSYVLKILNHKTWELYANLAELEEIFSIIRRIQSYSNLLDLEKAILKLETYIERNKDSSSRILLDLKIVRTLGQHKLWYISNHPKELQFLGVIQVPLFSDMKEFSDLKGDIENDKHYERIRIMYSELISNPIIHTWDNYPEILSAYSLFLVYSPQKADREKALGYSKDAFKRKRNFSIVTNHGIILYRLGQKTDTIELFKKVYLEFESNQSNYLQKTIYPEIEVHFYKNGEKKIASLNYASILLEGNERDLSVSEQIISQNLQGSHTWIKYLKGKLAHAKKISHKYDVFPFSTNSNLLQCSSSGKNICYTGWTE